VSVRCLHVFSTFAPGGPQVRTARLLPELPGAWKHAILALDGCTDARTLLAPELGVELLAAPPRAGTPRTTLALARILRRERPELLLTYNFGALDALLAARLVGLRAVVHHEDGFRPDEVAAFKRRREWARRLVLAGTRAVIVPSFTLERIARERWKLSAERLHRIPNGIRVEDFPRADGNPARRAALGIPREAFVFGFVGHLRPEKNPVRAVLATALVAEPAGAPPPHLLILGDGPERGAVEEAVRNKGLSERVHLVGHRADPREDYRAMDAFLISSDTEQMPVALLEAMACGLPVVSTDVGDVRAILPKQGAFFVAPAEADALAAAMGRMRMMSLGRESYAALGQQNFERVQEQFAFGAMVDAYRAVYARALGLQGAPKQ